MANNWTQVHPQENPYLSKHGSWVQTTSSKTRLPDGMGSILVQSVLTYILGKRCYNNDCNDNDWYQNPRSFSL